jgi:Ca2+-binding RTX toxin-like protein
MAFTTSKPVINIDMLDDITANKIWADSTIQWGWGGSDALRFDKEFKQIFQNMFGGGAKPDAQFKFFNLAERAFDMIDSVAGVDFAITETIEDVDLILTSTNDKPNSSLEGFFQFPDKFHKDGTEDESWSFGSFNSALGAMKAKPEDGGGQYANWTVLHEIGHGLGLMHTHQEKNGLPALPSIGKFMNNERYSVMSYNGASDATKYGHAVSMMALDVAALQALYGQETYALDGSSYTLMNAKGGKLSLAEGDVQIGRAYYCIWDSGGSDTIDYKGNSKSVLNDATLDTSGNSAELQALFAQLKATNFYDVMSKDLKAGILDEWHNAGGFFSQVLDVKKQKFTGSDGGFSIANGAEIENANGGKGHDLLIGNEQDNSINGLNGDDTILGGDGEDRLSGDDGIDWLDGGTGDDHLWGGASKDIFVFSDGYGMDFIRDFEDKDVINLKGLTGFDSMQDLFDNHMFEDEGDVVVEVGDDFLIIEGVTIEDLGAKHFVI